MLIRARCQQKRVAGRRRQRYRLYDICRVGRWIGMAQKVQSLLKDLAFSRPEFGFCPALVSLANVELAFEGPTGDLPVFVGHLLTLQPFAGRKHGCARVAPGRVVVERNVSERRSPRGPDRDSIGLEEVSASQGWARPAQDQLNKCCSTSQRIF